MHQVKKILSGTRRVVRSLLAERRLLLVQVVKGLCTILSIITWGIDSGLTFGNLVLAKTEKILSKPFRLARSSLTLCLLVLACCIPICMIWAGALAIPSQMQTSVAIASEQFTQNTEGKFVSVTGQLTAPSLSDPPYLAPVPYLSLKREVSMLSWVESSTRLGEEDSYSYNQEWREMPPDSSRFYSAKGHTNPPLEIQNRSQAASTGKLGVYTVDLHLLKRDLPEPEEIVLTEKIVNISKLQKPSDLTSQLYLLLHPIHRLGNAIYYGGDGVGDIRIRYLGVPYQQVTLFAQVKGNKLVPYRNSKGDSIYILVLGDRSAALREMENRSWTLLGMVGAGFLGLWMLVYLIRRKVQPGSMYQSRQALRVTIVLTIIIVGTTVTTHSLLWVLATTESCLFITTAWFGRLSNR
jgi:hypothetical protein